ncbi:MAG: hypothetical protein LBJ44_09345 [Propionibacteriaceae bacterium]|jgi:hypothetical protein|nr:hypothetical protein [Propionibacteriaceae bacterium]
MTAQPWQSAQTETEIWERPRLRLIQGRSGGLPESSAIALDQGRPVSWELTRRGLALSLGLVASLFGGAAFTIVWNFFQITNGTLP